MAERAPEIHRWLIERYQDEQRLARQLDHHADAMRYEFLKTWLHRLAEHDREHAKRLHEQIVKRGGEPLPANHFPINDPKGLSSKVRSDVDEKRQLSLRYLQGMSRVEDEDLQTVLGQIAQEEAQGIDELLDIVTRVM